MRRALDECLWEPLLAFLIGDLVVAVRLHCTRTSHLSPNDVSGWADVEIYGPLVLLVSGAYMIVLAWRCLKSATQIEPIVLLAQVLDRVVDESLTGGLASLVAEERLVDASLVIDSGW